MKYWFTIWATLTEEEGRKLWQQLNKYNANLTILDIRTDIYGDADTPEIVEEIEQILINAGYNVERG